MSASMRLRLAIVFLLHSFCQLMYLLDRECFSNHYSVILDYERIRDQFTT